MRSTGKNLPCCVLMFKGQAHLNNGPRCGVPARFYRGVKHPGPNAPTAALDDELVGEACGNRNPRIGFRVKPIILEVKAMFF